MEIEDKILLETCIEATRAAADHALTHWDRRIEINVAASHDIKLVLDVESQAKAEAVIQQRYPHHDILGEEGQQQADSRFRWIIDPIDGTMNFARGLPHWCSTVAVQYQETTVAGCVYCPVLEENYTATLQGPAQCNGQLIHASDTTEVAEATLLFGPGKPDEETGYDISRFQKLINEARIGRMQGAAAIDICWVADGRVDAYVDNGIYLWDYAAAGLIAERAGAKTALTSEIAPFQHAYLASTPAIFESLRP